MAIIISKFNVKAKELEFAVDAKDWYNAIQLAYQEYVSKTKGEQRMSYMEFRDCCWCIISCDICK